MTIYDTYHPLFFATLFRSYFQGEDSVAAGCPAESVLPLRLMEAAMTPALPSCVFVGLEHGTVGAKRAVMISVQLFNGIKASDVNAANVEWQTSLETVSGWLVKMELRMRQMSDIVDGEATIKGWNSWLAAQDADLRNGWRAKKFVFHGIGSPKRVNDTVLVNSFSFELHYALV